MDGNDPVTEIFRLWVIYDVSCEMNSEDWLLSHGMKGEMEVVGGVVSWPNELKTGVGNY